MKHKALIRLAQKRHFVLGSGSPRRFKMLSEIGIPFAQITPNVTESLQSGEDAFLYARRLAVEKAQVVTVEVSDHDIVLGADTVVVLDGRLLGKPANSHEAFETLSSLVGKKHIVATALALVDRSGLCCSGIEKTTVRFRSASEEQLRKYIASGEPLDKAGAYGIQGMGAFLVDSIEGNLDNVIGLPCTLLEDLVKNTLHRLDLATDCK